LTDSGESVMRIGGNTGQLTDSGESVMRIGGNTKRCHFSFPVSRYRPKLYAFQVLLVLKILLNSSNMLLYDAKVCQKVYSSWYSRLVSLLFNYLNICPYVRTLLFLVPHIF